MALGTINTNQIASEAVTVPKVTDQVLSSRNLIINGAMQVAQRGTSFSSQIDAYTLDRMKVIRSGSQDFTVTQESDAPTGSGLNKSIKIETNTADSTLDSGDYSIFRYNVEGQDLQQLAYGSSGAKSSTLSFWIKSNMTGNLSVTSEVNTGPPFLSGYVTINAANTWEYKTITYIGNTSTAINNDNTIGLEFQFWLSAGTAFSGGTYNDTSWNTNGNSRVNSTNQINIQGTTGNYVQITGLQYELGSNATPFEHRSYADELARCQRYYWRIVDGSSQSLGTGTYFSSSALGVMLHYPVTMRVAPSKVVGGGTGYFKSWRNGGSDDFNGFTNFYNVGKNTGYLQAESADGVSGTQGHSALVVTNNASAYVDLDAEL